MQFQFKRPASYFDYNFFTRFIFYYYYYLRGRTFLPIETVFIKIHY